MEGSPGAPDNPSQLIARAIRLLGSEELVRQTIGVTVAELEALRDGRREPTAHEFHQLVALILREQERLIERNRELLSRLRAGR